MTQARRLNLIVQYAALVIVVLLVALIVGKRLLETSDIPLYPGAVQVDVRVRQPDELAHQNPEKTISFVTSDRAEKVISFYDKVLAERSWYRVEHPALDNPNEVIFAHGESDIDYETIALVIGTTTDSNTKVSVRFYCRC